MFRQVSIDEQKQDTCIEELSNEYLVGNGCQLLTVCVFTNPLDQFDDNHFENSVDSNDKECNAVTQNKG